MSQIDRAFIDAYRDGDEPATREKPAPRTSAKEPSAAATTAPRRSPKRAASQAKRGAAAAAIKSAAPAHDEQPAAPLAPIVAVAGPSIAATAYAVESLVAAAPSYDEMRRTAPLAEPTALVAEHKVVVGRRALQQLADSAAQATSRIPPVGHQKAAAAMADRGRVAASTARTAQTVSPVAASQTITGTPRQPSNIRPPVHVDSPPTIVTLEVDSFNWPDTCDRIVDQASSELKAAAELLATGIGKGVQVVSVAATGAGAGATTMVLCLARMLAREWRVCVVDANLQRPALAESLQLAPDRDLADLLNGKATLAEILVESLNDRMTLLPLVAPLAPEVVERSKLRLTLTVGELRERFDLVLIDAGAVAAGGRRSSILQAGSGIDAGILVRSQQADGDEWEQAQKAVEQWSMPCLGVIENECGMLECGMGNA
jgi:Mrp family chromosome partitioning ATPase